MPNPKLILDYVYDHEAAKPNEVFLVQPIGGGRVVEYTWRQMLGEARSMAEYLNSRGFEPGARMAMLSKNCAHCFMVELAVWMAGGTTVAIFPTEAPRTCATYSSTARRACPSSANSILGRSRRLPCLPVCHASRCHWRRAPTSRPRFQSLRVPGRWTAART